MNPFNIEIPEPSMTRQTQKFNQILASVKLHNTLRLHLDSLESQHLILKVKQPLEGRGRPKFTYSAIKGASRVPSMHSVLPNSSTGVVSLSFDKLSQICRFEKGGFCKKVRGQCNARVCPQIR